MSLDFFQVIHSTQMLGWSLQTYQEIQSDSTYLHLHIEWRYKTH